MVGYIGWGEKGQKAGVLRCVAKHDIHDVRLDLYGHRICINA
jgi:hypothetical protein